MLFVDRRYRLPRLWSNQEIKKLGTLFTGSIANISGWEDSDKEGGRYKKYFPNASSYTLTNYSGEEGFSGSENEIFLNLTNDLPKNLYGKFDLCFNHTTLEHIFDVRKAFASICALSKDAVLLVVPFSQIQHQTTSYEDFWRFTPTCIQYLFKENGYEVVYESESPHSNAGIYLLHLATRHPEQWRDIVPPFRPIKKAGANIGISQVKSAFKTMQHIVRKNHR